RPAHAADRRGRAGEPGPRRPERHLGGGRRRLRQPLGELLLPRPRAAGPRGPHRGRRERRPPRGGRGRVSSAYVLLEDGARFDGDARGADGPAVGEIVFTTSMSGYQEAMSDPSFAGQLIAFTYPHIGNYGVSAEAMESGRVHARAAIMRAAVNREDAPGAEGGWCDWLRDCGVPAITDLDTRALVRHIRDAGAMRGGLFPARVDVSEARALIDAEPSMNGRDLAREV